MSVETRLSALMRASWARWDSTVAMAPADRRPLAETHKCTSEVCWSRAIRHATSGNTAAAIAELQLAHLLATAWSLDPGPDSPEVAAMVAVRLDAGL